MFVKFTLGSKPYVVEYENKGSADLGEANYVLGRIKVKNEWEGEPIPKETMEQIACHELVHCIFEEIGRNDLSEDEHLVQGFALLLHQFLVTKEDA